jgi:pyruvate dehydrogenase E1 component alpha subunit
MEHSIIEKMLLCRRFDEEIIERYPRQLIRCPVHLSCNQEAIAVGACHHLTKQDSVFSTHRNHSHFISKGGDIEKFTLEIYGKADGCNGGRGGSMHALDTSVNFFSCPIVASAIPLAVGAALANKIDGNGNVVVCFFGDAAVEEGVFHEALNFASLMQLPIIFVCENNQYSVDTPIKKRQPDRSYEDVAKAHNISHWGMLAKDVFILANAFKQIIDDVRKGKPYFIDVLTERSRIHCGIDREFDCKNDPLKIAVDASGVPDLRIAKMQMQINDKITAAFDAAESAPLPTPEMASKYVYA